MGSSTKSFGLYLLLVVCVICQSAGGGTSTYVFLSGESKVVKTGGFAGVHETYPIEGQFRLSVDFDAGTAFFSSVDANLIDESGLLYERDLGFIFNMSELAGAVVDDKQVDFAGKTADGTESEIIITLTFREDSAYLTGRTVPPPDSADMFFYELDAAALIKYGGGTGEPDDPYLIYTAEQMNTIGAETNDWDKHFKLMEDVDLSIYGGTDFNIIGISFWDFNHIGPIRIKIPFTGTFDGNCHTISNFTYVWIEADDTGIFGYVNDPNAQIRDLGLIDPNVDAGVGDRVGSLVGCLEGGTITNCYVKGGCVSSDNKVGGLVGLNGGTITNCFASASILGYSSVGGLVGANWEAIANCYSVGNVTGTTDVGGLIGGRDESIEPECTDSFWDIQTSGQLSSIGGTGKTTAEMQTMSTFTDAGWDFVGESENGTEDIWSICEGTNYPRLVGQIPAGDFVCPDGITIEDFVFFMGHWGDETCDSSNDYCEGTDLDFSGRVDVADLEILVDNWLAGGND